MKKQYKKFLKSHNKILILNRDKSVDMVSNWKKVKNPLIPPFNYLIVQLSKLSFSMRFTRFLYKRILGMKIGKNTGFAPIEIDPLCPELISIGDNSGVGWGARIMGHEFSQDKARFGKVDIGKNVLIGAFSTIRSGVAIGDNSIVGMNSFVNKDIPKNEMWGGVPAKKIKNL